MQEVLSWATNKGNNSSESETLQRMEEHSLFNNHSRIMSLVAHLINLSAHLIGS